METPIEKIGECWIWELVKINRLRKKIGGWLGYYTWRFADDCFIDRIEYIHIKPFLWKHTLRHEQGHAEVTRRCKVNEDAILANSDYDAYTWHGILWWRNHG